MILRVLLFSILMFSSTIFRGLCDMAFMANLDGNWDLIRIDENGRDFERLTQTPYDEKDANWSADQKKIVFASSDGRLRIIDTETKNVKEIAGSNLKYQKISPFFSSSGQEIVFAQFRPPSEGDDTDLLIYHLKTGAIRRLLDQYSLQMWPAWSPDGKKIVYANMHCSAECGRMIQELWIADAAGNWARQLLMTHSFCQHPVWSPDGQKIAFSSDKSGNFDIWIVDLKDWKMEQVTTHEALDVKPAWSPDGQKLAFVSTRSGLMEIWIKDLKKGLLWPLRPFNDRKVECKDVAW